MDQTLYTTMCLPLRHTLISPQHLEDVMARVELLEQELERAHGLIQSADERDRETRRLLAAALERIPPQLEAPPARRERVPRDGRGGTGGGRVPVRRHRCSGGRAAAVLVEEGVR